MVSSYRVEKTAPRDAERDVLRIWRDNLPKGVPAEQRFRWAYLESPDPPPALFLLSTRGASGSTRIGTAGFGIRLFTADGMNLRASLMVDLAVDRAHRSLMPALMIMGEERNFVRKRYDFCYGFPNKRSSGVMLRCGYRKLGQFARYAAVLRYEDYLQRHIRNRTILRVVSGPIDLVRRCGLAVRSFPCKVSHRLLWTDDVDSSFDELWSGSQPSCRLMGVRSSDFLRWRFQLNPAGPFRFARLIRRNGDEMCGYAVVQRDGNVAHIRDIFAPAADLGKLLDLLLASLHSAGCTSASFCFLGDPSVVEMFRSRGFALRESNHDVVFDTGESGLVASCGASRRSWYLTDADLDG